MVNLRRLGLLLAAILLGTLGLAEFCLLTGLASCSGNVCGDGPSMVGVWLLLAFILASFSCARTLVDEIARSE